MSLLLFFIVLAVLVLSHEFGHFIVAKYFGIRVDEFGFGFPPRLFAKKMGETEYSFNVIPFGGFVKIFGEDETEDFSRLSESGKDRSLLRKPKLVQAAVIVAGVLFNFILAWLLFSGSLTFGTKVASSSLPERLQVVDARITITNVLPNSPASRAGLVLGDEIIYLASLESSIQGEDINVKKIQDFISNHEDKDIYIGYMRGPGPAIVATTTPVAGIVEGRGAIGISLDSVGILKLPFYRAIFEGLIITVRLIGEMAAGLIDFIYGFFTGSSSVSQVSGPVGLVGIVGEAGRRGLVELLNMTALISLNLAVINMIPFPALDGGRLLFLFAEFLRGRPIDKKMLAVLNGIGFIILISLMFAVTYSDIAKLAF
jgi:regulator of sigma E protease